MISESFRYEGFDADSWLNLLSLFAARDADAALSAKRTLIVIVDPDGQPCAALLSDLGPVAVEAWQGVEGLTALCERHAAARAVVIDRGAIEELTERAAAQLSLTADYVTQWLTLLSVARELEDEGKLLFWPARTRLPLPTTQMLRRALDLLLPDEHALLFAVWDGGRPWTALALHRRAGDIDRLVGPDVLNEWAGPLSGDLRRDHRPLRRGVERAMGPVHLGVFAEREVIERLLSNPTPGAWARAVALRDLLISPAPPYAHMAVGADAARAAGSEARRWLGGLDVLSFVSPVANFAREHVARVGSITSILGFNPLQALAARRKRG